MGLELRHLRLTPPPKKNDAFDDAFHHSFYLATHVVYVQSAYNAIKANEREIPWLYRYVRQAFRYWMRQARAKESDHAPHDPANQRPCNTRLPGYLYQWLD